MTTTDRAAGRLVVCACTLALLVALGATCYRMAIPSSNYARHILDVREGMALDHVHVVAGEPDEMKVDYDGNPLWVYEGYDVHFANGKVSYVDPW